MSEKVLQTLSVDFNGLRRNLAQSYNQLVKYLRDAVAEYEITDDSFDGNALNRLENKLSELRQDIGFILILQEEGEFDALENELYSLEDADIQNGKTDDESEVENG